MASDEQILGQSPELENIKYRALVESIPVVTYIEVVGRTALPLYLSPQYFDWFGYTPEERIADPDLWEKLLHPDDREAALAESRRTAKNQEPFRMDYRMHTRDGRMLWIHDECVLIKDERGTPLFWQGVMVDITRTKLLEEERRAAEQSRAEFFEIASHELRSPVTSILGFSATLLNLWNDLSEEDRIDSASRIHRQAKRLGELVEDLLTLSLVDDGRLTTSIERLDLCEAIGETVEHLYLGNEAKVECAPGVSVLADRRFLSQMLVNYLTNADRYGRPPTQVVAIVSGDMAEIRVEDSGDGVPPAFVPKLFTRFARGENRTFPGAKSVGLGLSIVRDLARIQGGKVWYEESKSGGSCFCFSLPLAADES